MKNLFVEIVVTCDSATMTDVGNKYRQRTLPKDLARFKSLSKGHGIIMERAVALSFGHSFSNRVNYVLTQSSKAPYSDQIPVKSIEEAIRQYVAHEEARGVENAHLFVLGGEKLYELSLPYLTHIHATFVFAAPSMRPCRYFPWNRFLKLYGDVFAMRKGEYALDGKKDAIPTNHFAVELPSHTREASGVIPVGWKFSNQTM